MSIKTGFVLLTAMVLFFPYSGNAATKEVRCGAGQTIRDGLKSLQPGDTLLVSGVCEENVEIGEGFYNITLDGQRTATIIGPDTSRDTIRIMGRGITIKGFTIIGGRDGINLRGATGTATRIENNTIENARNGITVHRLSFAIILGNTIQDNLENGIWVFESSSARIGFATTSSTEPTPNIIQRNAAHGILVSRCSNARILGNLIRNNSRNGVHVERVSHADLASNTIDGNLKNGIEVTQNSGVNLGTDTGQRWPDLPNKTVVANQGIGIQSSMGSYVDGRLGSLTGKSGTTVFDASSISGLLPVVTSLSFEPASVSIGGTFTASFSGVNLSSKTYLDIRFRRPGKNVDEIALDWQQGVVGKHIVADGTATGTWSVTGVRAHEEINDHTGDFAPVSLAFTVTALPFSPSK